jgi:mannose-6-phosphate isomerase
VNAPIRFEPFLRPMVWGGRRLGDLLGKRLAPDVAFGEAWEISDHDLHHSRVAAGTAPGRTLRDLMEQDAAALLGKPDARQFPWLVKFLDACDWLSVQVHPDDRAVRELWPGERGKTEAWFVIDARPGSRIYAGLRPGVDEPRLRRALEAGAVVECLHSFEPRAGDCVFLPAGTVHAVGGGVLLAEVQQTSDATFRLFDWNRRDAQGKSRTLHIREGLACIDWSRGPVQPVHAAGFTAPAESVRGLDRQPLVRCAYFDVEYIQSRQAFALGGKKRLQALIVLRGGGRLGSEEVTTGQVWLLPAAMPALDCEPGGLLGALLCTLPD